MMHVCAWTYGRCVRGHTAGVCVDTRPVCACDDARVQKAVFVCACVDACAYACADVPLCTCACGHSEVPHAHQQAAGGLTWCPPARLRQSCRPRPVRRHVCAPRCRASGCIREEPGEGVRERRTRQPGPVGASRRTRCPQHAYTHALHPAPTPVCHLRSLPRARRSPVVRDAAVERRNARRVAACGHARVVGREWRGRMAACAAVQRIVDSLAQQLVEERNLCATRVRHVNGQTQGSDPGSAVARRWGSRGCTTSRATPRMNVIAIRCTALLAASGAAGRLAASRDVPAVTKEK